MKPEMTSLPEGFSIHSHGRSGFIRKLLVAAGWFTLAALFLGFLLISVLGIGWAPFTSQSPAPFELWEETVDAADSRGIDYGALVTSAYSGSPDAIRKLMRTTDALSLSGAGSYGHGAAMIEILWHIGEKTFLENLKALPSNEQKRVGFILCAGDEYTLNEPHREKLKTSFPALSEHLKSIE